MDIETIYNDYFRDVYLFLRSLSADAQTSEEITQETFARALAAIDSFDGRKDIRAWLFTIARNTYYSYCRRNKIYVSVVNEETASPAAVSADFSEQMIDAETAFLLKGSDAAAPAALPPDLVDTAEIDRALDAVAAALADADADTDAGAYPGARTDAGADTGADTRPSPGRRWRRGCLKQRSRDIIVAIP